MMSNIKLEEYYIVYQITIVQPGSNPLVLYAKIVTADNYIKFEKFFIPSELENKFIECQFNLFNNEGELVEYSHNIATNLNITSTINNVPLKMLKNLLSSQQILST